MTKAEKTYVDQVCKQAAWLVRGSAIMAFVFIIPMFVQLLSKTNDLGWFWVPIAFALVIVMAAVLVGFTSRKFLIPWILATATLVFFGGTYFTL